MRSASPAQNQRLRSQRPLRTAAEFAEKNGERYPLWRSITYEFVNFM